MSVEDITIGDPFFSVKLIKSKKNIFVNGKAIVLNLSNSPLKIRQQVLGHLQSVIVIDTALTDVQCAVLIEGLSNHLSDSDLLKKVCMKWPTAFEVRKEERLRGVEHYMSPKQWVGQIGLTFYCSMSVPLKVGLHKDHPFCPLPGFREVHTQVIGVGKMQQCYQKDIRSLYIEELNGAGGYSQANV